MTVLILFMSSRRLTPIISNGAERGGFLYH